MVTRAELLDEFETKLNGFIIRCDEFTAPGTGKPVRRKLSQFGHQYMADKRSLVLEIEKSPDGASVLEKHITFYWDAEDGVKKNVQFYVVNRNEPNERARWLKGQDPLPKPPDKGFQQVVREWMRAKIGRQVGPWTVKHVSNVTADQDAQTATARALCEDNTGNAWIEMLLSRDARGNVKIEVLKVTRLGV